VFVDDDIDDDDVLSCANESVTELPLAVQVLFFASDKTFFLHIEHKKSIKRLKQNRIDN